MSAKNNSIDRTSDRELKVTRVVNAPRELVYEVWTDPKHLVHWWGPDGFTISNKHMDVKPGGKWDFIMHGPDGRDFPNLVSYEEVVENEKLVWKHGSDIENDPGEFHVTVTFEDEDAKTRITMTMLFKSAGALDKVIKEYGAIEGNTQTLNRLESYLANIK